MSDFPTDETTLTMLIAACRINPDTGRTHLMDFLSMGERVKSETPLYDPDIEPQTYFVEHEEGYEPFSPHEVIDTLAQELLALRAKPALPPSTRQPWWKFWKTDPKSVAVKGKRL